MWVNGSHHHFTHPTKPGLVTRPHPKKDLPVITVKVSGNRRASDRISCLPGEA
ncbi:type II toxin-antitoxin system HicA family toxin [Erwinia sp. 198]|uniref:type II toxin-antitoxin system HicA family toxin n=1 Tax=Erwinia sp. 198 TaxID=2022746 RepID=UPI001F207F44|nr:type II toxin-antitoxin system HicA family toxin [Erwinia sp. 198]